MVEGYHLSRLDSSSEQSLFWYLHVLVDADGDGKVKCNDTNSTQDAGAPLQLPDSFETWTTPTEISLTIGGI